MADRIVRPARQMTGSPVVPGDKSVSHRALIFGALADGVTEVQHLLESADVQSTARCLRQMGVEITKRGPQTFIKGRGAAGLKSPSDILDCGNSGTTMRLLMGVLSGQKNLKATLTGDSSLLRRPMKRVAEPLRKMGADIVLKDQDFAPVTIIGQPLNATYYELKIASAQIKTAIILAALSAEGTTRIFGEIHSRDHTERLLSHFGVQVQSTPEEILVPGGQKFRSNTLKVPGDPSTAAFWLAAACLVPNANLHLNNISLNPTRTGFIRVLQKMGAQLEFQITEENPEPIGNIHILRKTAKLKGVQVTAEEVPSLIDELPMLAVLATQAEGRTEVVGAEELRVKETDRIEAVAHNLRAMGARIETRPDGFVIEGPQKLLACEIDSFDDHRIAMAFSIGALVASSRNSDGSDQTIIHGAECVAISYPEFYETLESLA